MIKFQLQNCSYFLDLFIFYVGNVGFFVTKEVIKKITGEFISLTLQRHLSTIHNNVSTLSAGSIAITCAALLLGIKCSYSHINAIQRYQSKLCHF